MIAGEKKRNRSVVRKLLFDTKLKYKLIVFFSFTALIPLLLLGLYYNFSMENSVLQSEMKSMTQNITQLNSSMDMFLDTYLSASSMLFNNVKLQEAILSNPEDFAGVIKTRQEISNMLNLVQSIIRFPEIRDADYIQGGTLVQLYIQNEALGKYSGDIMSFSQIENEAWCKSLYQSKSTVSWQTNVMHNNISYVVLNRRLVNFSTEENIGVLRIYIPTFRLQRIVGKGITKTDDMVLYASQDMTTIAFVGPESMESQAIQLALKQQATTSFESILVHNKKYLLQTLASDVNGWKLYYFASTQDITERTRAVTMAMFLSVFVALLLCIGISFLVSSFITKRLDVLVDKTNQTGTASLVADLRLEGDDEIGQLDRKFNGMLGRINDLIEREYKSAIRINQTRLELLQEQINPHMLYNTLSMISMISRQSGAMDILSVSNHLIGFYKGILSRGKIVTSIGDEIAMIGMYIEIMKFVYKMDIDLVFEIDEELLPLFTIKLILQPLVENAVIHGLRPANGGVIVISGHKINHKLCFEILDSGIGIPDDIRNYLLSSLGRELKEKGYGLSNVARRINLFFGDEYGVSIESEVGAGTKVGLSVPALNKDEINDLFKERFNI